MLYCVYCSAFTYFVCFQAIFNLLELSKHSEHVDTFIMASDESFIKDNEIFLYLAANKVGAKYMTITYQQNIGYVIADLDITRLIR